MNVLKFGNFFKHRKGVDLQLRVFWVLAYLVAQELSFIPISHVPDPDFQNWPQNCNCLEGTAEMSITGVLYKLRCKRVRGESHFY